MEELKVGDVVILNSGGPNMLIRKITKKNNAKCIWIDKEESSIMGATFPVACLTKVTK